MNALLHISDIHMGAGREIRDSKYVVAAVRGLQAHIDTLVVAITGDIAYSGQPEQYTLAKEYFAKLRKLLAAEIHAEVHLVVCPGNHDCSFPADDAVRELVIDAIRSKSTLPDSRAMVQSCTSVQVPFFDWLREMDAGPEEGGPSLAWVKQLTCRDDVKISVRVLNTAWMSSVKEVQGGLFFPTSSIPDIPGADVRVTLLHHPYAWFQSANGRELRHTLEDTSDLILSGHEHDYDEYTTIRRSQASTGYVEGGCFAADSGDECAFSIVLINSIDSQYAVMPFCWNGTRYAATHQEPVWQRYVSASIAIPSYHRLSQEMQGLLEDPGLQLTHRAKTLTLEDIFVPPDLRSYKRYDQVAPMDSEVVPSRLTINTLLDDKYAHILGDGQCGKTSLAKMLFLHASRRGLTPVLIAGSDLRKADEGAAAREVEAAVRLQYARLSPEEFWQTSPEVRVILVDDFGESPLNASGRAKLLAWLKATFSRAFLLGGDLTQVEELVALHGEKGALHGFKRYEIRPFGHFLRDLLIEKWITLGQEDSLSQIDLQHRLRTTAATVSTILGNNLLPANPVYVLILLQQLEASVPLDTTSGSYGYFYETVLTLALKRHSRSADDLDAKYTYLSELAWHLHIRGQSHIDEEGLGTFTRDHLERFRLGGDPSRFQEEVLASGLLPLRYGRYRFVYRYLFCYFIARYMRDNLDNDDVQSNIDAAVREIHREDFANVLIFLTYLTKSRPIIQRVLHQAQTLFAAVAPSNLADHVAFIDRIQDGIPAIVLPDGDPGQQRRALLGSMDAASRRSPQIDEEGETDANRATEDGELEELLSFNRAIKTLQVLGQIVRNFSGSLRSDTKLEIIRECFDLGLRVFNSFCTVLEKHLETTLGALAELFGKSFDDLPERQRVAAAKRLVFFITELMCLATLRRISYAVGSEALVRTYEELEGSYDTRATRFVQLSLRLDHCRSFPEDRVLALREEVGDDVFGLTLLRMLVAEHFYLFERPYRVRQSVTEKLGISYKRTVGSSRKSLPGNQRKK